MDNIYFRMDTYLAQIPVPSMGATVVELTVIDVVVKVGESVEKGQKCAEFESDKSAFDFEAPCSGTVKMILGRAGDFVDADSPFIIIETSDSSQQHLKIDALPEGENNVVVDKSAEVAPAVKKGYNRTFCFRCGDIIWCC